MKRINEALYLADSISAHSEDKGMASVGLQYEPYIAEWHAEASWSDNSREHTKADTIEEAVQELIGKLKLQNGEIRGSEKESTKTKKPITP